MDFIQRQTRGVSSKRPHSQFAISPLHLQVFNSRGKKIVTYHRNSLLFRKKPTLDVEEEALDCLDLVIIGLLIMMRDAERRRENEITAVEQAADVVSNV